MDHRYIIQLDYGDARIEYPPSLEPIDQSAATTERLSATTERLARAASATGGRATMHHMPSSGILGGIVGFIELIGL